MWLSKILHALSGRSAAKAQEERTDTGPGTYVHNLRVLCDIVERQLLYPDPPTTPGQAIVPITLDPLTMDQLTKDVLKAGPEAVGIAKRLAAGAPLSTEESARLLAQVRASAEGREGVQAFLEKRPPDFMIGQAW